MPDLLERLQAALSERYAIDAGIGRGGMAVVFLAEDLKHHRQVAIKVLDPDLAAAVGPERFLREIEIAAGLDHPHILTLLDSGETDGLLYYVMPFVEGESLRDRLQREQQLPVDEAIRIAREVADGLDHAHRHGVIHRDVKPANIMLSEGHALIADFGVARAVGGEGQALTSTGLAVGTPAYLSPEQASGSEVGARSDLYALGCVLYEMLAGEPPLVGATPQATAAKRLTETATALHVVRETVPAGVERVVNRLLAKSSADRYATAEELVEALDRPALWAETGRDLRVWKRAGGVAVALTVLALGILASQRMSWRGSTPEVVAHRIAVLPFDNETDDPTFDYLGELVANRITTRLQVEGVGEVVPTSIVAAAVQTDGTSDDAGKVAGETGAGVVITGSIGGSGDSLLFAIRVMDPVRRIQAGYFETKTATVDFPDPGLEQIESRVAGGLLLAFEGDPFWAYAAYPRIEAYVPFAEASLLQQDHRNEEAIELYLDSWALDSTFVLTLYFAGGAAWDLGEYQTADSLNQLVGRRFRETLTGAHRLHYDGSRAWFEGDLDAAYRAQQRVVALKPELWYQRHLLGTYCLATNRPAVLVETMLEAKDRIADDPVGGGVASLTWHLRHLARGYHMLGEHEQELEIALRLEQEGWVDPLGTEYFQGRALAALGRTDGVRQSFDRMVTLADSSYRAGLSMLAVALELRYHGFPQDYGPAVTRSLTWFEQQPGRLVSDPGHRAVYGAALYHAERWTQSEQVLREIESGSRLDVDVLGYLGLLAARRGDWQTADPFSAELERIGVEEINARARTWAYRARIAAVLGDRSDAVTYLKRAFDEKLNYMPSPKLHAQYRFDFEAMSDYAPYQELLRPKG